MISKEENSYYLVCDNCEEAEGPFKTHADAVAFKRKNGYKTKYDKSNGWQDICPACAEDEI